MKTDAENQKSTQRILKSMENLWRKGVSGSPGHYLKDQIQDSIDAAMKSMTVVGDLLEERQRKYNAENKQ